MQEFYEVRPSPFQASKGTRMTFPAHYHNDIEIICLTEGELFLYNGQKEYFLSKGDIFVSFPNQIHQYEAKTDESHIILIFDPAICEPFRSIFTDYVPLCPHIIAQDVPGIIGALLEEIVVENHSNDEYSLKAAQGLLVCIVGKLLRQLTLEKKTHIDLTTTQRLIHYCLENFRTHISLDDLSKKINSSKYHISHIFSEKIKLSFNHYINRLRVGYAADQLLSTDKTITEIAYESGFESTRTFNRAFLQFFNLTPKEFKEKNNLNHEYNFHIQQK